MGRDVIAYLEYGWNQSPFVDCYTRVIINRNHKFFSLFDSLPLKGLPEKVSNEVFRKFFVTVPKDEQLQYYQEHPELEHINRKEATELVASGDCFYRTLTLPDGEHLYISSPAWYGATYLSSDECRQLEEKSRTTLNYVDTDFSIAVGVMDLIEKHKKPDFVRLVLWSWS
jgi:hypothetical protein